MSKNNHPEDYCQRCGGKNAVWFAPSELWNAATDGKRELILCPACFIQAADERGLVSGAWSVAPEAPPSDLAALADESEQLAKDIPDRHEKGLAEEFFLTTGEIFGRHAVALRSHRCSPPSSADLGDLVDKAEDLTDRLMNLNEDLWQVVVELRATLIAIRTHR